MCKKNVVRVNANNRGTVLQGIIPYNIILTNNYCLLRLYYIVCYKFSMFVKNQIFLKEVKWEKIRK